MKRPLVAVVVTAAAVLGLDQTTKTVAVRTLADGPVDVFWTLRFHLSFNRGIAFSMGTGLTPLIIVVGVVLVGALVMFARRATSLLLAIPLGLVLGGALGNLGDRVFRGHGGAVVDFIDVQWWPVFNVADMALSTGAVLLIVGSFVEERRMKGTDAPA